ncbi:MAG: thiol:disulfide interchange protein [Caulobacter sp.]|nr:thiol:disulfide interchange protein [Caulobacter sp.]
MRLLRLLPLLLILLAPASAFAQAVNSGHIESELVAQQSTVAPGATTYVGLRQKISPGWHTYWRNAGDAGEPTAMKWTLPNGWSAGDIVWATPRKEVTGPLTDFGYEGEVILPVPIKVAADAKVGSTIAVQAAVSFLVCKDVCVPEDAVLNLTLKVGPAAVTDAKWGAPVAAALAAAPKAGAVQGAYQWQRGKLTLALTGAPLKGADLSEAFFFPYSGAVILHPAAQAIERGPDGLTLTLSPNAQVAQAGPPAEIAGIIVVKGGAFEVTAKAGPAPAGASGLGPPPSTGGAGKGGGGLNVLTAIISAVLGGLILNLMPCVFPVLSMKAASLAGHGAEAKGARAQGIAFLVGVVATFLALAGSLLALKAAGQALGWGFQLQSPPVVAALTLVMLLTALNLSGVFEIGTSVQGAGQGLASRSGLAGAFFTGALAVVVAAPCTAPFMGPALGFALVQSAPAALAVFLGLALGFAAPFTALAFMPALLNRLPRPGPWMDGFKHILAFPMYGAAAWLAWVLAQQAGSLGLARLFGAGLLAAFAAWLFGVWQRRGAQGSAGPRQIALGAGAAVAMIAAFAFAIAGPSQTATLKSEPWSVARVAELRAEGRPVLVNFTAAWCVTCQVNDRIAIETAGTAQAFKDANAAYLVGDWTNRNPEIEAALTQQGRAGVPLYLVYPAAGGPPKTLPQVLTEGIVVKAVKEAAAK